MEETADLSDNPNSSHEQSRSTMEVVDCRKDLGMPDAIRILVEEFELESLEMRRKIHRFPASLAGMADQLVVNPMELAIGPYHHGLPNLQGMEKAKRVAAYIFVRASGLSHEEMYGRVLAVADQARRLYADDAVSGFGPDKFADMMFYDACFLLQYMQMFPFSGGIDPLQRFFLSNKACIDNDIMLLENQIPWCVIQALMTDTEVSVDEFITLMGGSMSTKNGALVTSSFDYINMAPSDRPAHLLGLLRLFKQGASVGPPNFPFFGKSASISAMEFEGSGIKLDHSKTIKFDDMEIRRGLLFDKLFLPSLILDRTKASWLANMVAFEVCTTLDGLEGDNGTFVCSYVAVLAMLMDREEDVRKLRSKGFIGGELSDKQILDFYNRLAQQMIPGPRYFEVMSRIGHCQRRRWVRIMVCKFVSDNAKAIAAVLSIIGVLVGIFKALYSIKQR